MAAPQVAGALALLKSEFPELSSRQLLEVLKVTAQDLGAKGVDPVYGHGLIDLRRVDTPPEGFLTISKAAEMAGVPCYAIVHLILGGLLDGVARLAQVEGYSGILVDPNEVRAEAHRFQQGLSPGEAFGKLKVPKDTGWALVHRAGEVALKPLVTIGPSGHRFYRFDEAEVSGFARRFTTEIRIANGLEVQCNQVVSRLKKDRIRPVLARREIGLDLYRTADLPASYFP